MIARRYVRACFFAVTAFVTSTALGQKNVFELHLGGKPVGKDTFSITKTKKGYKLTSRLDGSIKNSDLDFLDTMSFDDDYVFLDASQTTQGTNQLTSWLPSKDRKEMTVAVAAGGGTSSNPEPITGPNLMLLLPWDAGAAQALLLEATTHPTPDNLYTLYLPSSYMMGGGGGGRDAGAPDAAPQEMLPPGIHCFKALWAQGRDLTGTLEEKPITVHTYQLAFGKFRWIFFTDEQNNLMQLNVTLMHASYIREKFKLDAPK